jgi:hypothetical protein
VKSEAIISAFIAPSIVERPAAPVAEWQSRWWIFCGACRKWSSCAKAPSKVSLDLRNALVADVLSRHPCSRPREVQGAEPCIGYKPMEVNWG